MRQNTTLAMLLWGSVVSGMTLGCNPFKFFACKDEMEASQAILVDFDDQDPEEVRTALDAVKRTAAACEGVAPSEEYEKMTDGIERLEKQLEGLSNRKPLERPQLSDAELADLVKKGDPDCPRGQQYEHPQNKKLINCTGPQLIEMNWAEATAHFVEKRGFSQRIEGPRLHLERGAEVFEFAYDKAESAAPPACVTVVGVRGISWQELVARATGVQPRRLKLGKPVPTKRGPLPLLVEGDGLVFSVKLGECKPTPGQEPYSGPDQ